MLSNQSKYAIRSVLYLAMHTSESHKLSSKKVAEVIDIPAPFLAKIFQTLSKSKIIRSTKGPKGGFYLTKKELSKNLLEIIKCIDGIDAFENCFLGLSECSGNHPCAVHHIVVPFRESLIEELSEKTIENIADDTKSGKSFIFLK